MMMILIPFAKRTERNVAHPVDFDLEIWGNQNIYEKKPKKTKQKHIQYERYIYAYFQFYYIIHADKFLI